MSDIKPGDTVLCVRTEPYGIGKSPPLRKEAEYHVISIDNCNCSPLVDVGLSTPNDSWRCPECNQARTDGIWWCDARRFVKKISAKESAKNVKFNKKLIEEPLYSEN